MKSYSILFADPDTKVHDGHRRMLKALKPDWSLTFAETGREALNKINLLRPDVIVAELAMPLEDGTDLLRAVQEVYPEVIRIVLSSEPDGQSEAVLRATQSAHRFLAKPCKSEALIEQIEQAGNLRKLLKLPELLEIVGGIPYLPSLPALYHELVQAIESPLISLSEIGEIVSRDVSMTSRVLHLVNSAFFGLPKKISNPQTAVVMLGLNVIKSLVCYVKLFYAAPDIILPGLALDSLWQHSSLTARFAKEIAHDLRASAQAQEDAFLAGMLHDIGKLLLIDHPEYFNRVLDSLAADSQTELAEAEYNLFNTSHAEIGAYLLGLWGLPDPVVEAVACHHRPDQLRFQNSQVIMATHIANALLCQANGETLAINQEVQNDPRVKKLLGEWQKRAKLLHQETLE